MKIRLLTILLSFCLPLVCHAQQPEDNLPEQVQLARLTAINICGGVTAAPAGCTSCPGDDESNDQGFFYDNVCRGVPGATTLSAPINVVGGQKFTVPGTGSKSVSAIGLYGDGTGGTAYFMLGIYNDNSGNPSTLVTNCATSELSLGNDAAWAEGAVSGCSVTGGSDYWIVVFTEDALLDFEGYSSTGGTSFSSTSCTYPTWCDVSTNTPRTWNTGFYAVCEGCCD